MADINSYWPVYNGTMNADDPLVAPWWIPGWTAQDKISIEAGSESLTGPGFPNNLSFCRVTHSYFDPNSSGIPGFLTIMMSDGITVTDGSQTVSMPQRLAGTMNAPNYLAYNNWGNGVLYFGGGFLDITLFCTDQSVSGSTVVTDMGGPLSYWVTEHFMGGRQYQITVPSADAATGPVDLNSLIVAGSVKRYAYDPVNPMGNFLIPLSLTPSVISDYATYQNVEGGDDKSGEAPADILTGGTSSSTSPATIYDGGTS